jgi:Uma2 family endonuclease
VYGDNRGKDEEGQTMSTALAEKLVLRPGLAGALLTPREFDAADDVDGDGEVYELINGVLVVSPPPLEEERDPNGELEYLLRVYKYQHPQGAALNKTLSEHLIQTRRNRRRADRAIWAGLGRKPRRNEVPTIAAEFVSKDKRDWTRDYRVKKREYKEIGIKEYWIIDRFRRIMTVFINERGRSRVVVVREKDVYRTPLLPGFELPLAQLLAVADEWDEPAAKRRARAGKRRPKKSG